MLKKVTTTTTTKKYDEKGRVVEEVTVTKTEDVYDYNRPYVQSYPWGYYPPTITYTGSNITTGVNTSTKWSNVTAINQAS